MEKNLTAYLFSDERGRHFAVVASCIGEAVSTAIDALRVNQSEFRLPRYQGINHSMPGTKTHVLRSVQR